MFRNDPLKRNDGDYVRVGGQTWHIPWDRSTTSIVLPRWTNRYLHVVACCTMPSGSFHTTCDVYTKTRPRGNFWQSIRGVLSRLFSRFVLLVRTGNKMLRRQSLEQVTSSMTATCCLQWSLNGNQDWSSGDDAWHSLWHASGLRNDFRDVNCKWWLILWSLLMVGIEFSLLAQKII